MNLIFIFITIFVFNNILLQVRGDVITKILETASQWADVEDAIALVKPYLDPPPSNETIFIRANTVRFWLYRNQSYPYNPQEIVYNDWNTLATSGLNWQQPVKFFIHGFTQNAERPFPRSIIEDYMAEGYNTNLIAVDWSQLDGATNDTSPYVLFKNYIRAVDNVPIVGERVGNFIEFLVLNGYTDLSRVHIVGFSLGAHVSGHAGHQVQLLSGNKVARITGLDPAGPLFKMGKIGRHLTWRDAEYVEFIHTDMSQSGTIYSFGHANYFVNGGFPPQPGCFESLFKSDFLTALPLALSGSCSHNMAPFYWEYALLNGEKEELRAQECPGYVEFRKSQCVNTNWAVFGEHSLSGSVGQFYIEIRPDDETPTN